jgi:hypothetical protein
MEQSAVFLFSETRQTLQKAGFNRELFLPIP